MHPVQKVSLEPCFDFSKSISGHFWLPSWKHVSKEQTNYPFAAKKYVTVALLSLVFIFRIIQKQKSVYPVNLLLDGDMRETLNTKTAEILTLNVLVHTWQSPNKEKWLNCLGTRAIHDLLPRSEKASFPKFPVAPFSLNRAKPLKQDLRPNLTTSSSLLTPAHIRTTKGKQLCFPNDKHNQSKLRTEPQNRSWERPCQIKV